MLIVDMPLLVRQVMAERQSA